MTNIWLKKFLVDSGFLEESPLTEHEKYVLNQYLNDRFYSEIAVDTNLTEARVKQLMDNAFGKLFFHLQSLMIKVKMAEGGDKNQVRKESPGDFKHERLNIPIADMPFTPRARKVLDSVGIKSLKELTGLNIKQLQAVPQVGTKTINEIVVRAEEFGITIK